MKLLALLPFLCVFWLASGRQYPDCFVSKQTWNDKDLIDTHLIETPDAFRCQAYCAANSSCSHFTWITEDAILLKDTCLLFNSPDTAEACKACISGPKSCVGCGFAGECVNNGSNLLDVQSGIVSELQCQVLCTELSGCQFYTYFDSLSSTYQEVCALLSSCSDVSTECDHCYTGPVSCSSTSSSSSPTTTSPSSSCDSTPSSPDNGDWYCTHNDTSVDLTCFLECSPGRKVLSRFWLMLVGFYNINAIDLLIWLSICGQMLFVKFSDLPQHNFEACEKIFDKA